MRRATSCRRLGRLYFERYGAPLFISETASVGSVARRRAWLDASVAATCGAAPGGRSGLRLHLVADVRPRRLGLSPGPAAAARPTSCRWACGTSIRLPPPPWRGFERPSSTPIAISSPAGATASVASQQGNLALPNTVSETRAQWIARCFAASSSPGFEGSTGYNRHGRWFDQVAATGHDRTVEQDYRDLAALGIHAARETVRWPLVDHGGRYDFSSLDPFVEARAPERRRGHLGSLPLRLSARRRPLERPVSGAVRGLLRRGRPLHRTRKVAARSISRR